MHSERTIACKVSVHSCQITDTEKTESSFDAPGAWMPDINVLTFRENIEVADINYLAGGQFLSEVTNRLAISNDRAIVYRNETLQFEFILGETTGSLYQTPIGNLDMKVTTRVLNAYTDDTCGSLHIEYELVLEDDIVSMCVYEISFTATAEKPVSENEE